MGRGQSPAEAALKDAIARAVTPALKAAGFRKDGLSYHRRRGEAAQVVNIQVSHGSTAMEKTFYLNAGLAFDAVCRLAGLPVLERPKDTSAMTGARGIAWRLCSRAFPANGMSATTGGKSWNLSARRPIAWWANSTASTGSKPIDAIPGSIGSGRRK